MSVSLNILCLIATIITTPEIMLHLTRTRGSYAIFTEHTVQQQRSLAHTVSLDEIQHGHPLP